MDYEQIFTKNRHALKPTGPFTQPYVAQAPLALALERIQECRLMSRYEFTSPILDVGCGDGIFGKIMFTEKLDFGLDPNKTELERAKKLDTYHHYLNEFGDKISLPSNSIATVISNSVLEHIPNLEAVLSEIHRVLKPDGTAYFTVPTSDFEKYSLVYLTLKKCGLQSLADRFSKFYNRFWAHYHAYDSNDWIHLFEKTGYNVNTVTRYCSPRSCLLHDSLVPLAIFSSFSRKLLNRWFFFPRLRAFLSPFIGQLCEYVFLPKKTEHTQGGLIFFILKKPK